MKGSSALILVSAIAITVILVLVGLVGIVFGLAAAAMGGDSWLVFAVLGLVVLGCGIAFAFKLVVPAWKMTRGES